MSLEIERKFMIDRFPEHLKLLCSAYIEQGYVSANPEVRIRHGIDEMTGKENYTLTIKGIDQTGDISIHTTLLFHRALQNPRRTRGMTLPHSPSLQ